MSTMKPVVKYTFHDGCLVVALAAVVTVPIAASVVARHRLLRAACGGQSLEDHLVEMAPEDLDRNPLEELERDADYVAHPQWEDYDDLRFAQVLFSEAQDGFVGPWGEPDDGPEPVASREAFLEDVRGWASHAETELDAWLRAGEAALRLDATELRLIAQPIIATWKKRSEFFV
jgi:hypothetical protein